MNRLACIAILIGMGWRFLPAQETGVGWVDGQMVRYTERIPGTDVTFKMVPVPGGVFRMGSPPDEVGRRDDEGPPVDVRVAPMWVGQCEVTQEEYAEYEQLYTKFKEIERGRGGKIDVNRDRLDVVTAPTEIYDPSVRWEYGADTLYPAVAMTQYAAMQYTKWLSALTLRQYRLPTEAEWEYACRGGTTTRFHWGDDETSANEYAWTIQNTDDAMLRRVGKRQPNPFGLHDMHGNVAEWTASAYTSGGYTAGDGGRPLDAIVDNVWPKTATGCVVRGGLIESDLVDVRSAARMASDDENWKDEDANFPHSPWWHTTSPATAVGFRLVRSSQNLDGKTISKFWNHTADDVREDVQSRLEGGRGAVGIINESMQNWAKPQP